MQDEAPEIQGVPWYGHIKGFEVIVEDGALGDQSPAAAIAVLIEGGQMFLFDDHLSPNPLSLDLQELPQLTVSSLESSASSSFGPNAVDVERLQVTFHSEGIVKTPEDTFPKDAYIVLYSLPTTSSRDSIHDARRVSP